MSVRIILNGCFGRMGKVISGLVENDDSVTIAAGIDITEGSSDSFPVFKDIDSCDVDADVIVDFSLPTGTDKLIDYAIRRSIPVVLCTTGLSDAQLKKVKEASEKVAILRSANMSLGVNILMKVLKDISPILAESGFDIEIVEKHHREKKDAPSGTAIALAEAINESLNNEYEFVFDRSGRSERRPEKEIGISAVRGGTIPGDHDVIFAGMDETITLTHRTYSRSILGNGALAAARFLSGKGPGMYDMSDVLS
ncbi:MAG: 4-hydroxy-tetrahydrodipicolinate reductase [Lachnospiraceae bacterium]|nr:4-hydroxy-tetrahydrodipicolinate reductase [Lachnospiraceae bacterium]